MSIEQTSVSNPVVRENEIGSKRSAWSETQGSTTGSKDGQLSSFWDKAFIGAQKLFGIDTVTRNDLRESEESLIEEKERKSVAERRFESRRLNATPGFGNSGFGSLSASIRRENQSELPARAEVAKIADDRSEISRAEERLQDQRVQDSREEQDELLDLNEELEDDSESRDHKAKTAGPLPTSSMELAKIASKGTSGIQQTVDKQLLEENIGLVGANSAKSGLNMSTNLKTNSPEETVPNVQSPLKAVEEVSLGGVRRLPSEGLEPSKSGLEISRGTGKSKVLDGQNAVGDAGKTADLKSTAQSTGTRQESAAKDAGSLTIDAEKAKQSLSAILDHARSANSSKIGQANSSAPIQASQSGNGTNLVETPADRDAGGDAGSKSGDVSKSASSKSSANNFVRQDTARPTVNPSSSIVSDTAVTSESRRVETRTVGNVSRPSGVNSISGKVGLTNQSVSVGTSSVSAGVSTRGNGSVPQNPLDTPVERSLGKQEFESALKGSAATKSTGVSSKADGVQGIQLAGNDTSGSGKSSFVAKAQPVSFASKSVEETKEIYTALSKSVDRLVSSKSDAVSIRINFDQGGSMALRVSMDSGHINTAMQTDLPGLESLIKSSWSEFASDLNQKGVKLNAPQFSSLDSENSKNESFMNLEQKGGQSKGESSGNSRTDGSRRTNLSNRQPADDTSSDSTEVSSDGDLNTEQELKTYA